MKSAKLVRDKIPDIVHAAGVRGVLFKKAKKELTLSLLNAKLREELRELRRSYSAEEFADVLEVLRALADAHGIRWAMVEAIRRSKRQRRGGFSEHILMVRIGLRARGTNGVNAVRKRKR